VSLDVGSSFGFIGTKASDHTIMRGNTMAQAAKVDVERNLTAYFLPNRLW